MKPLLFVLAFSLTVAATGCVSTPVSNTTTNNPDVSVALLFEHDGCRVYRFYDDLHYIYYANCGTHTQASWDRSCGKNCVTHETDSTSTAFQLDAVQPEPKP
jgi:hypothetical protein